MQLYPILLVAVIMAADGGAVIQWPTGPVPVWATLAMIPGSIIVILACSWAGLATLGRRIARSSSARPEGVVAAERVSIITRALIMFVHIIAVLGFGWVTLVRDAIGNLILLDEIVMITPGAFGLIASWWMYYPIEHRVRESMLMREFDSGLTVHPIPPRGRYVMLHVRLGLLFILVPVLLIVGLAETLDQVLSGLGEDAAVTHWLGNGAIMLSAAAVLLLAPLVVRFVLDVTPIRNPSLRSDLLSVVDRHRVRVRDLLLWNTSGVMINAAVMGMIGRLRYVLLTDALLEVTSRRQLHAVMAHEIAHVKRHHLPWMVLVLIASMILTFVMIEWPVAMLAPWVYEDAAAGQSIRLAMLTVEAVIVIAVFGWVSRRFERQADTFAVEHMCDELEDEAKRNLDSNAGGDAEPAARISLEPGRVHAQAVDSMDQALAIIATMNAIPQRRRSWRHGSIHWRRTYLQSLIGAQRDGLAIHRHVGAIKIAAAVVLIAAIGLEILNRLST